MLQYSFQRIHLQLRYTWAIARGATNEKTNFIIAIKDNHGFDGLGEVAPNIRYGETIEGVEEQLGKIYSLSIDDSFLLSLDGLGLYNSVRFGLEAAFITYHCNKTGISVSDYLQIPVPKSVHTAYTIPIMEVSAMETFYHSYQLQRFKTIKIKINAENGEDMIREVSRFSRQPLIVDANEAFSDPDDIVKLLEKLRLYNILLMEQPFPAALKDAYRMLKPISTVPVFADESVTSHFNVEEIRQQFHGVNMKLMKAGGWIKGVEILRSAKANGLQTMIGCMVETSLAISQGWHLCGLADVVDLDSFMVLSQEPFGLIEERNGELSVSK